MNAKAISGEPSGKLVTTPKPRAIAADKTPLQLLDKAMNKGVDTEQLRQFMDLQERWEKNEARKAYNEAIAAFKQNPPVVIKDRLNKQYGSNYASLANLVNTVNEALSSHGLNARWEYEQDNDLVHVICILSHYLGHSEKVTLSGPPDESGAKNRLQQIKSTTTYLKVATFEAVTGIASADANSDDDGNSAGKPIIDKKVLLDAEIRGIEYMKVCYEHKDVIEAAKDYLAIDDYMAAAEALYSLPNKTLQKIGRAPTKGGIFTLEEKAKMDTEKNPAWRDAVTNAIEIHKDVDRSM